MSFFEIKVKVLHLKSWRIIPLLSVSAHYKFQQKVQISSFLKLWGAVVDDIFAHDDIFVHVLYAQLHMRERENYPDRPLGFVCAFS